MTVLDVYPEASEWARVRPRSYSPAVRAWMAVIGAQWDPLSREYLLPLEALAIVRRRLVDACAAAFIDHDGWYSVNCSVNEDEREREGVEELYPYQRRGVAFIVNRLLNTGAALLCDDPGLGKSAQALRALGALRVDTCTIVCPAVVREHWRSQWLRWGGPSTVHITSYDKLRSDHERGGSPLSSQAVVLDELHYLANSRSKRSVAVRAILEQPKRPLVIGLSGTPIPVRVRDLWNPVDTLWPKRFGTWYRFAERYCAGHYEQPEGCPREVWNADGSSNLDELRERLNALMLRRERTDPDVAADIPPLQRIVLPIDLPVAARERLRQVAASAHDGDSIARLLGAIEGHKISPAVELIESLRDDGRKVLAFCTRKASAHKIAGALKCECVTGEVAAHERVERLRNATMAVATLWSVTTGVDLVHFDTIVFVGLDWVPSTLLQAIARVQRIGQRSSVLAYFLVGMGTADEIVRERVIDRLEVTGSVVGASSEGAALADSLSGGGDDDLLAGIVSAVRESIRSGA